MKHYIARLHLYALTHRNVVLAAVFGLAFFGRLAFTNPALDIAIIVMALVVTWHSFLPDNLRLSNFRLAVTVFGSLIGTSLLFAAPAEAISLGGIAKSLKNDMGSAFDALIYGCYGLGITATGVGINNGIKKSKGDQQVTTGSIFGYGLGGPALGMVGYIMDSAGESMGGGASSMNKLPGGL
ncbi:hypothetical protein SAMN03159335_06299 [Burkholderia cepacia]|uniref:hypothetical protein n=1 Tax=Burkholderia cepacia TaxID=292 RepID=UPI0008BAD3E9|nr:hypothetical protein [Burkholderia cepacia]SEU40407.1 hypothetical protein SAMN03159335_06299 [Burkholderia cepacia]